MQSKVFRRHERTANHPPRQAKWLAGSRLCFRLPLALRSSSRGFTVTLGRSTLVEFLSLNIGMIVFLPVSIIAYSLFPLPKPTLLNDLSSWLFYLSPLLLAMIAGLVVIYPIHAWLTH